MKEPPDAIWLQFYGDEKPLPGEEVDIDVRFGAVTWCVDKIFDCDFRYVLDKRQKRKAKATKR